MTLTHTLPSLRRTLADPLDPRRWPARTTARPGDVVVAGVSLRRLVDWCGGTPCLHSGDDRAVLVAAVEGIERRPYGVLDVWMDAEVDHCDACVAEARLIGRVSIARDLRTSIRPARELDAATWLPADLRVGDLLAIPVQGIPRLGTVQRGAHDLAREA